MWPALPVDQSHQFFDAKRFIDGAEGAETGRQGMGFGVAEGGHADKRRTVREVVESFKNFESGQRRHPQVG